MYIPCHERVRNGSRATLRGDGVEGRPTGRTPQAGTPFKIMSVPAAKLGIFKNLRNT